MKIKSVGFQLICIFFLAHCYLSIAKASAIESNKLHFSLQGNSSNYTLGTKNFNEYGIKPNVAFFPFRQLAFFGSYYAVIKPDGSSNINGFGFGAKAYVMGPGTSSILQGFSTTVNTTPGFAYYLGMEFQTRDIRSSSINLNYTGFCYMAGFDWHFHHKWFLGVELSYANLKNAIGAAAQELSSTSLGIGLGVML